MTRRAAFSKLRLAGEGGHYPQVACARHTGTTSIRFAQIKTCNALIENRSKRHILEFPFRPHSAAAAHMQADFVHLLGRALWNFI